MATNPCCPGTPVEMHRTAVEHSTFEKFDVYVMPAYDGNPAKRVVDDNFEPCDTQPGRTVFTCYGCGSRLTKKMMLDSNPPTSTSDEW
jgi:hypothetical protein